MDADSKTATWRKSLSSASKSCVSERVENVLKPQSGNLRYCSLECFLVVSFRGVGGDREGRRDHWADHLFYSIDCAQLEVRGRRGESVREHVMSRLPGREWYWWRPGANVNPME